jgi:flagellin
MFELADALSTGYSAHVILQRGYDSTKIADSAEAIASDSSSDNNSPAAVIRQLLRDHITASQQAARNASRGISTLQAVESVVADVSSKLTQMRELATKAEAGAYSNSSELHAMQLEFEQLADQINDKAKYSEFNGRELLATDSKAIEVFLDYESTIKINGSDLTMDISGLDLTMDPATALTSVKDAIKQANDYAAYISGKTDTLQTAAAVLDSDIASRMGFEPNIFEADLTEEIVAEVMNEFVTKSVILVQTQANANAEEVLQILKDAGDTSQ